MLNVINLQGRLCADPEVKTTNSGISVCSFRLAVERDFADKATGQRESDFIDITAWRGTADFVGQYFRKGDMMIVSGSLQSRKYTDKDGNNRTAWEVQVNAVHFCGGKSERTSDSSTAKRDEGSLSYSRDRNETEQAKQQSAFAPLPDDDMPF